MAEFAVLCLLFGIISQSTLSSVNSTKSASDYQRVCYYTNWAQYRPEGAKFFPEDIDPTLCSQLIYAFADINRENQLVSKEWNDETMYERVNNLKLTNSNLKTFLAVGGWNVDMTQMTIMLSTRAKRKTFISSTIELLRSNNFDGLTLNFAFPGNRGSNRMDKFRFTRLCKELRAAFEAEGIKSGSTRLMLSISVSAKKSVIDRNYEPAALSKVVDFIYLMAYDFHDSWEGTTGHNSPLFSRRDESSSAATYNVRWAARYWVSLGANRSKVVIGMVTYANGYTLVNPKYNKLGARTSGSSFAGSYTGQAGILSYYEVCGVLNQPGAIKRWNNQQKVPYVVHNNQWIAYNNRKSLTKKVKWMKKAGFGGFMVWTLDFDDFTGEFCGEGRYPLLHALNNALGGQYRRNTNRRTRTTTTTAPRTISTTVSSALSEMCSSRADAIYPHPTNCSQFVYCVHSHAVTKKCPKGLVFNPIRRYCDWLHNVPDCQQ